MRTTVAAWTTKKAIRHVDGDPLFCARVRRLEAACGARGPRLAKRALQSREPATPQHRLLPRGVAHAPRRAHARSPSRAHLRSWPLPSPVLDRACRHGPRSACRRASGTRLPSRAIAGTLPELRLTSAFHPCAAIPSPRGGGRSNGRFPVLAAPRKPRRRNPVCQAELRHQR